MIHLRVAAPLLFLAIALPRSGPAQGYRLRLDTRAQAVAYRGVQLDSVPVGDTVTGPTGGPTTQDGFAVRCPPESPYCSFFRPGLEQNARPVTGNADLTVWGLGLPGLSIHAIARLAGSFGAADPWPGTEPSAQLLESYAQYAMERLTLQLGRQTLATRFGLTGFDGGRLTLRDRRYGLDLTGYGGWGLWRGSVLPVTSPDLNPLGEYRPPERTLVAGAGAGWTTSHADVRFNYQREVDPSVHYFVSERTGVDAAVRPYRGVTLSGGAEYDIAQGWWGSAEGTLAYAAPNGRVNAAATMRRYRPHFDLWTIWGAFAPVPYTAIDGSLAVTPIRHLELRANGEHYTFADASAATPTVNVESDGWRFSWNAAYTLPPKWTVHGGYHAEFGPGASSRGFEAGVAYSPTNFLTVAAHGGMLDRPLELRFNESSVRTYGLYAQYQPSSLLRVELDASRYDEDRKRPDAAAFSWDQVRVSARIVFVFASGVDLRALPPAVLKMPRSPGTSP